jgi:sugar phosphate isomerase/epimerase
MRLGGMLFELPVESDLDAVLPVLDTYGLSAIAAPRSIAQMTDEQAIAYGSHARALGLVVGEVPYLANLMTFDESLREERITTLREVLCKAELMSCRSVLILVGTRHPSDHLAAPHPYMYTDECEREFGEVVLRVLDDLPLETTKLLIEPWSTTFFYQPKRIQRFLQRIDHPRLGLHLDQMNMVEPSRYFETTALIEETFDLLAPFIGSVHLKDIRWDWTHMFLKLDEVLIGEGVLDYATLLRHLATLDEDMTCFCEHLETESEYATCFDRLHRMAEQVGARFVRRAPTKAGPTEWEN